MNARTWHRCRGAFANKGPATGPCDPTIGLTTHTCGCCDRKYLVVACVAEDGTEVNVGLPLQHAPDLVEKILELVEREFDQPNLVGTAH